MAKNPKPDGGSSITQASCKPDKGSSSPYKSGANVHKGSGGKQSAPAPASQPKGRTY